MKFEFSFPPPPAVKISLHFITVEIKTVKTRAIGRIAKRGSSAVSLIRPGEELTVLAVTNVDTPVVGNLWVVRGTETAIAVDADTIAAAGDWLNSTGGSLTFDIRERGLVRKQRQATGTRMRSDAELIDCFCLEFSDGKPVWVAGSFLSLVEASPPFFSSSSSTPPTPSSVTVVPPSLLPPSF